MEISAWWTSVIARALKSAWSGGEPVVSRSPGPNLGGFLLPCLDLGLSDISSSTPVISIRNREIETAQARIQSRSDMGLSENVGSVPLLTQWFC